MRKNLSNGTPQFPQQYATVNTRKLKTSRDARSGMRWPLAGPPDLRTSGKGKAVGKGKMPKGEGKTAGKGKGKMPQAHSSSDVDGAQLLVCNICYIMNDLALCLASLF